MEDARWSGDAVHHYEADMPEYGFAAVAAVQRIGYVAVLLTRMHLGESGNTGGTLILNT